MAEGQPGQRHAWEGTGQRVGQGWGPEGWPGGGTGSGRHRLGAAEPAAVPARDCLGIPGSPERGGPGTHRTLPPCCPAGAGPGGCGQPEVRDNRGGGRRWMGQIWGQWGRAKTGTVHDHCASWAWVCKHGNGAHLPIRCHCPCPALPQRATPQHGARHGPRAPGTGRSQGPSAHWRSPGQGRQRAEPASDPSG